MHRPTGITNAPKVQRRGRDLPTGPSVSLLTLSLLALGLLVLGGCGRGSDDPEADDAMPQMQGPPPAAVRLAPAAQEPLQTRWDAIGQLREIRRAVVAAEVAGRVIEIPIDAGDPVVGGETELAKIDAVWARLVLAQADAEVRGAEALLDQTQRDLQFLEELQQAGSARPREVEDARALVKREGARLDAARAARDRARQELQRTAVLAPFDGLVVRKMTEVGQWLDPGAPVAEVVTTGSIDAVVDVPENLVNHVRLGQEVELLVQALDLRTTARVVSVTPLGADAARTYPVKLRLDDRDGRLKPGMTVVAEIPTSEREPTLTVPRDAVIQSATGPVVWMAVGEPGSQMAMPQPVRVLFGHGDRYAVRPMPTAGPPLTPDTHVVIEGAERLFPTQPLMPAAIPTAAETSGADPAADFDAGADPAPADAG
jgi:membrane fusion protein, multidrug efflux system